MKKLLLIISIAILVFSCGKKSNDPQPQQRTATVTTPADTTQPTVQPTSPDSAVMFTLYSNRVPYIWKRVVNTVWVQDTIKTNHAVRYEPYDTRNMGIGYFVTMNLAGQSKDSLHIIETYNGKTAQMASVKGQSFAFVKLDNVK